ncbi:GNAT family N-acetyltransferase [Dyadobacter frigoris]|uniref:N-acetyltransferase family protein n=1 Tax=Dyadobacter frigoris TaxID=2576211 RepID=A0A4U6D0S7_9BACT|nr:GNAT family N-acetyltransferase [Dyadobacter frigoris]TKT89328.1 N-acetyltransferase family protein [Dyadobacter frigoris]GLU55538.1 N-acetyltransferase [Dyadobacter frigoris]
MNDNLDHQNISFRPIRLSDAHDILNIVNYYISETTFHFSDEPIEISAVYDLIMKETNLPRYVIQSEEKIIGFGYAYDFRPENTFSETVKLTYWLKSTCTGKGIGSKFYHILENELSLLGIKNILVNISSKNLVSLNFHKKLGYVECGNFKGIAHKKGTYFDIIWLQKTLQEMTK